MAEAAQPDEVSPDPAKTEREERSHVGSAEERTRLPAPSAAPSSAKSSTAKPSALQSLSSPLPPAAVVHREFDHQSAVLRAIKKIESAADADVAPYRLKEKVQAYFPKDGKWWDAVIVAVDHTHDILEPTKEEQEADDDDDEPPMIGLQLLLRDYEDRERTPLSEEDEWCYRIWWPVGTFVDPAYYVGRALKRKREAGQAPQPTAGTVSKGRARLHTLANSSRDSDVAEVRSKLDAQPFSPSIAKGVEKEVTSISGERETGGERPAKEEALRPTTEKKETATEDVTMGRSGTHSASLCLD